MKCDSSVHVPHLQLKLTSCSKLHTSPEGTCQGEIRSHLYVDVSATCVDAWLHAVYTYIICCTVQNVGILVLV